MKKINKIFKKNKSLSLDLYLEKILYDKDAGYYQNFNPFGAKGDFVTAPNISNIFCEMITIWLVSFWESLKKPKNLNFVELGPGNGDLCIILLKTLKNFPEAFRSIKIILYEKSKKLREIQEKRIVEKNVSWINDLKKIKKGPTVFFGNEFLDALPIKQFKKINGEFFERYATLKKKEVKFIYKKAKNKEIIKLKNYKLTKNNGIIEYPEYGFKELNTMCNRIKELNGGLLFIDYGFNVNQGQDTLQSVMKHKYNKIEKNIGKADITSLVNFDLYKKYFNYQGLKVEDVISQSKFLQKMGIIERFNIASKNLSFDDRSNMYLRLKRLIDPKFMGENFKVMFAKNKKCKFSLAFK